MTDYKTLSDSELTEALNFHRRQRNMSRGINEAAHMRQTQVVRLLEAEEARRLEEAVQVDKKNYSWGKMITVRHGSSHSFPLHPEHQEKIKNLKDGESTSFTDETRRKVKAHREGDTVHLQHADSNTKTPVAHSHFTEEVAQIDELSKKTLGSYVKKASTDQYLKGQAVQYHTNKANDGPKTFERETRKKHMNAADNALRKASNRDTGIGRAVDRLTKEEVELGEDTMPGNVALRLVDRHQAAAFHHKKNGNMKGYAAHFKVANAIEDSVIRAGRDMPIKSKRLEAASDKAFKEHPHRVVKSESVELDEVSASTLRNYIDKSRADKKVAMKDRTAAEKNVKQYGMASDKKERDDAARRVVNRNQGISVANKKLGTYPADKAKAKVMAREEVELDDASKTWKVSYDHGPHQSNTIKVKAKSQSHAWEVAKEVAKKEHGHARITSGIVTPVKEEVELDEASYRDIGYRNMMKADQKAEKELAKLRAQQAKAQAKKDTKALSAKPSKPEEFKEETDLRITKIHNKWPKKATYAVHTPDRKYFKEFDSMEAAKAHHAEKSGK